MLRGRKHRVIALLIRDRAGQGTSSCVTLSLARPGRHRGRGKVPSPPGISLVLRSIAVNSFLPEHDQVLFQYPHTPGTEPTACNARRKTSRISSFDIWSSTARTPLRSPGPKDPINCNVSSKQPKNTRPPTPNSRSNARPTILKRTNWTMYELRWSDKAGRLYVVWTALYKAPKSLGGTRKNLPSSLAWRLLMGRLPSRISRAAWGLPKRCATSSS